MSGGDDNDDGVYGYGCVCCGWMLAFEAAPETAEPAAAAAPPAPPMPEADRDAGAGAGSQPTSSPAPPVPTGPETMPRR